MMRPGVSSISPPPSYLKPYLDAAATHRAGFGSLLWASPATQAARFEAISRIVPLSGRSLLDVGCGRADFLDFLLARGIRPADYIGIEGVDALAAAAEAKRLPDATIIRADFVAEPVKMFAGADVVVLSGSLNTACDKVFYETLRRARDAAAEALVFNFLCSPLLAGQSYLHWRDPRAVLQFARQHGANVAALDDYLPGDMTVRM
jgi:hypothetical protein